MITYRTAVLADASAIGRLWTATHTARRADLGLPLGPIAGAAATDAERKVHQRLADSGTFAVLAELDRELVAMAIAMQALALDGASTEPVPGLVHVSMVAVRPDLWGQGLGALVLDRVLRDASERGFSDGQLWTHETNRRAQRLYERTGWTASGRTKTDDFGEQIRHYVRRLASSG